MSATIHWTIVWGSAAMILTGCVTMRVYSAASPDTGTAGASLPRSMGTQSHPMESEIREATTVYRMDEPIEIEVLAGKACEDAAALAACKGEVATGVIIRETQDVLYLDLTPCSRQKQVFPFYPPYRKEQIGSVTCRGRRYPRHQIVQQ